jgi:Transposase DDE domain group 1
VRAFSTTAVSEGFRVKTKIRQQLDQRKRSIERRLDKFDLEGFEQPMFTASNFHYEISDKAQGIAHGGIGALHALARRVGLIDAIDRRLVKFKVHRPYHESDHVLNLAYNALCEGTCKEDIELRRNDAAFLDAIGARRIPDPTTAGDFCRRFDAADIRALQGAFHETRHRVWAQQPDAFFAQAIIDVDGTLVGTTGACKDGMDISYKGTWGYHPLVVSLANTGEVLSIVNRPGNRPSHEGAAVEIDRARAVCYAGGFRTVLVRGDTDFSQSEHLDRWNADPRTRFIFGYDACPNLVDIAENLADRAWKPLVRPARYTVATQPRQRPANVKARVVKQREFDTLRLQSEEVAEFNYQPTACRQTYRMVVVRKNITKEKGELRLHDEIRYFFYITNDWVSEADGIVFGANDRCNQENLLAQLHSGCRALTAPCDNLMSNWAYMVMTALAWDLKAWWALLLPEGRGNHRATYRADKEWVLRLEFKRFVQAFVRLPCQIVRTARKLVYRLLSWNPYQPIFFRLVDVLRC